MDKYREIVSQNAGALLVLLPHNLTQLPHEAREVGLWNKPGAPIGDVQTIHSKEKYYRGHLRSYQNVVFSLF